MIVFKSFLTLNLINVIFMYDGEFIRYNMATPMKRFDALKFCVEEFGASFLSSRYFDESHLEWLYDELIIGSNFGYKYHRDIYNDSSFQVNTSVMNLTKLIILKQMF